MSKVIDITEKLSYEENPRLTIKGEEIEVNADAETVPNCCRPSAAPAWSLDFYPNGRRGFLVPRKRQNGASWWELMKFFGFHGISQFTLSNRDKPAGRLPPGAAWDPDGS